MPLQLNPFTTNPVVPTDQSFQAITLSVPATQLVWPSSFVSGPYNVAAYLNITSNNNAYNLVMPDAMLAAPGTGTFINNVGTNTFNLVNSVNGSIIAAIAAGSSWIVFLTDNSTAAGTWQTVQAGSTTSSAVASALAGNGLEADATSGKLDVNYPITSIAVTTPITSSNQAHLVIWRGGTDTLTLPAASASVVAGFGVYIRNSSPSNGVLTVTAPGGATIDGQANLRLTLNQSALLVFDGTNWYTVGLGIFSAGTGVELSPAGIKVVNGLALTPSYSFINAPATGFYLEGDGDVGLSIAGVHTVSFGSGIDNTNSYYWHGVNLLYFAGVYPA